MVTSRIRFTAAQKAELWERWKNGQSAAAISRALERKNKTGVERIVVVHGGIVPAPRQRALAALRFGRHPWDRVGADGTIILRLDPDGLRRRAQPARGERKSDRWIGHFPRQPRTREPAQTCRHPPR